MTRSAARRQNRNARMIVADVSIGDASDRYASEGAFTADDARRSRLWPDPPAETNWPLCAELLNRKARYVDGDGNRYMLVRNRSGSRLKTGEAVYLYGRVDRSAWTGVTRGWTA